MRLSGKALVFAFTFFSLFASFILATISSQAYVALSSPPNWQNYLGPTQVWNNIIAKMGGAWYLGLTSLAPVQSFFAAIMFPFAYIYSLISFVITSIGWIFGFFTYPYQFIPYPLNYLFGTSVAIAILIILMFGIRLVMSGLSSGDD
jgi:hypothetical protein